MSDKGSIPIATIDQQRPYLLFLAGQSRRLDGTTLEPEFRRMGLNPRGAVPAAAHYAGLFVDPPLEVGFASQRALAGPARPDLAELNNVADARRVLACVPLDPSSGDRVSCGRELFKLAVLLIDLCSADQIYWSPAGLWSDARQFQAAVTEMLASGMPPVLHLVAFRPTTNGTGMQTQGLAHFAGQELVATEAAGLDRAGLLRRMARLAIDIMINGAVQAPRNFPGLVQGERISVRPDGGTVYVTILAE